VIVIGEKQTGLVKLSVGSVIVIRAQVKNNTKQTGSHKAKIALVK
jgi:hypothetical protein